MLFGMISLENKTRKKKVTQDSSCKTKEEYWRRWVNRNALKYLMCSCFFFFCFCGIDKCREKVYMYMTRSCSTSLESICKCGAVATHPFYMLHILQTATPTHRQYEALGLGFPGCCMHLEPASCETAVIPILTQLIWRSVSIRKRCRGGGAAWEEKG